MYCTPMEEMKARKPHRCTSCGEVIEAGATYCRWRSYDCGEAGTNKMHPECYAMHSDDAEGGQWEYSMFGHERPVPNAKVTGSPALSASPRGLPGSAAGDNEAP
jgi:predicted RNA-binding Zn-ribbon protein involved in translation (DUF1610 family)